jgi:hypothetical protein
MWNDITLALVQSSLHLILQVAAIVATHPLNIRAHMRGNLAIGRCSEACTCVTSPSLYSNDA